jgi:hypothetical protein
VGAHPGARGAVHPTAGGARRRQGAGAADRGSNENGRKHEREPRPSPPVPGRTLVDIE